MSKVILLFPHLVAKPVEPNPSSGGHSAEIVPFVRKGVVRKENPLTQYDDACIYFGGKISQGELEDAIPFLTPDLDPSDQIPNFLPSDKYDVFVFKKELGPYEEEEDDANL